MMTVDWVVVVLTCVTAVMTLLLTRAGTEGVTLIEWEESVEE